MPKSWNVTTDFFFNFWQILDDFYPLCYSPDISIPVSYLSRHIFEGGPDRLRTILYLTRRLNCVEMNLFQSHMLCHWQGILIWCGKMCERNISHSIQKSRFNVSLDDFLEFSILSEKNQNSLPSFWRWILVPKFSISFIWWEISPCWKMRLYAVIFQQS